MVLGITPSTKFVYNLQSPLECGDFYFPVLMFEDLPMKGRKIWSFYEYLIEKN